MAKFDASDPRWIVEERNDGTNVHNWHWKELDCLPWAKQILQDKFNGLDLLAVPDGRLIARTDGLESLKGEVFTNIRKNKIIPSYELELKIGWKGGTRGGDGIETLATKGWIHLPYLADENSDEKPEVKVAVEKEGSPGEGNHIRQAILVNGIQKVHDKILEFLVELGAGGPNQNGTRTSDSCSQPTSKSNCAEVLNQPEVKKPTSSMPKTNNSLKLEQEFYASPRDIYECFVSSAKFQAFSMSPAKIEARVGGEFSWFGGSVCGIFKDLKSNEQLCLDWRFNNWVQDCYSQVVMDITSPQEGSTLLKLVQKNIPGQDQFGNENIKELTENGWKQQIFDRIRAVFGYGL